MTAKIIRLEQFNVGCRHHANGVRFPVVYRVTGFEFDWVERGTANERFVPGKTPVEAFYTLSDDGDFGVADPTFRALKSLVPGTDKGWVIVRHHATHSHAAAYIDGAADLRPLAYPNWGQMLWQSADGFFTVLHRPATLGMPDNLIAYVTKVPLPEDIAPGYWEDAHHIVHADGSVTTDPEIMYRPDSEIVG